LIPGTFATLAREWSPGDEVVLRLPMEVEVRPGINNSAVVRRGPLVYSLPVQENWRELEAGPLKGFGSFEVTPRSAWNYALDFDPRSPAGAFVVVQSPRQIGGGDSNPLDLAQTPVTLQVRARKLPGWTLAWDGRTAFDPPVSPVQTDAVAETITLAPFGSQMLRVTNFPFVGLARPAAREFRDSFAQGHFLGWIPYGGGWFVRDGALRASPNDGGAAGVKAVATATHFADFTYDATVTVGGQGDAGVVFRVTDAAIGADAYKGYYVGISAEHGTAQLGKSDNRWTPLATARRAFVADTPYRLRVEARGPRLRIFVDDMNLPLLEATDGTYQAGSVGVRHYVTRPERTHATFSKISVMAV
jgi:hypothetical protein